MQKGSLVWLNLKHGMIGNAAITLLHIFWWILPDCEEQDEIDSAEHPDHRQEDEEGILEVLGLVVPGLLVSPHLLVHQLLLPRLLANTLPDTSWHMEIQGFK